MAYNKRNKLSAKELTSENQNNCIFKFKPMLVKDLYKSFEQDAITTDTKRNSTKAVFVSCRKTHNCCKTVNSEGFLKIHRNFHAGSLIKFASKSSEIETDVKKNNKTATEESQKKISNKYGESAVKMIHDNCTMTSPNFNNDSKSKSILNTNNIKSPLKTQFGINTMPCNCANRMEVSDDSALKPDFNATNVLGIQNVVMQLKTFLEQSIQVYEDQTSKLKQILNKVNDISNAMNCNHVNDFSAFDREGNNLTKIAAKDSLESAVKSNTSNLSSSVSNQETNQLPQNCFNVYSKAVNESQMDYLNINIANLNTPKKLKSPWRRTVGANNCNFQNRRRSLSTPSESDLDVTQGSFTMLEKELNIVYKKLPIKSLHATPMDPSTPSFAKQWDKGSERPLQEYMALKSMSCFLATPDVNWYQSRL